MAAHLDVNVCDELIEQYFQLGYNQVKLSVLIMQIVSVRKCGASEIFSYENNLFSAVCLKFRLPHEPKN